MMSVPPEIDARWMSLLIVLVHEIEALRRERRSRGGHRPHGLEPVGPARLEAGLASGVDELRRRAEQRHPGLVREVEQDVRPSRWNGEPSYKSIVAPQASVDTSQFHIIQPHVVK